MSHGQYNVVCNTVFKFLQIFCIFYGHMECLQCILQVWHWNHYQQLYHVHERNVCKSLNAHWKVVLFAIRSILENEKGKIRCIAKGLLKKLQNLKIAFMTSVWSCVMQKFVKEMTKLQAKMWTFQLLLNYSLIFFNRTTDFSPFSQTFSWKENLLKSEISSTFLNWWDKMIKLNVSDALANYLK